jgi:iron complex outermembrane receptor protein
MTTQSKAFFNAMFIIFCTLFGATAVLAQDQTGDGGDDEMALEEVVITGTRRTARTATDSTVPVDSFTGLELEQDGVGDATELLKNTVPSYTATPLTGDGSSFVRSTSLRGLPPDEVLVLVNSKRRHRSSLIQIFGAAMSAGAHASDIGPLPSTAFKSVEVLRDGAAAQYGSDAIAGVINFILQDSSEGGRVQGQYGQYYEGEESWRVSGNIGLPLTSNGFFNFSFEIVDNEQLIRGFQPAAAQAAIDAGIPNVGTDSPYPGDTLAQTWGRPENTGVRTAWNAGIDINESTEFYFFGNYAETEHVYRFFCRAPDRAGVLTPLPINPDDPSEGNFCWCDQFPGGFTPYLEGDITDFSLIGGFRGEFTNGMLWDVSLNYGNNEIDYTLWNTLNPSFGPESPQVFKTTPLEEEDINFNADFSMPLRNDLNLAFGFEWREETYKLKEGQFESWAAGPWTGVSSLINPETGEHYVEPAIGANGMSGTPTSVAGSFSRDNWAIYGDLEWDITDDFLLQFAARFEDFSDFGSTDNYKLAGRWNVSDTFTLRGAISSGFRAPTPGQSNLQTIVTTFDTSSGTQTQEGTVLPTSDLAVSLGGKALDAEESTNISIGFAANPLNRLTLTLDYYRIDVDDRIVKTFNIPVDHPLFSSVSFYTNGLNTRTQGIDLVAQYVALWDNGSDTTFGFAWNWNETDVRSQNPVNGIPPVTEGAIFNIENNLPENRINISAIHHWNQWTFVVRANYYDETIDERNDREPVGAETIWDVAATYEINDSWLLTAGANNVFDTYPNRVETRVSNGLPWPRRTPMGYDGGSWYLRGEFRW